MLYINKITRDPSQQMILTGLPGQRIVMTLKFMPRIEQWVMGITWNGVSIQGIAVVASLNLLRQFRHVIPFGISCIRGDGLDPYTINDFADRFANLYLLNATDIEEIEEDWFV